MGSDGKGIRFCLAALKGHAVHGTVKINNNLVAVLNRAVFYRYQAGILVLDLLKLCLNIRVGHFRPRPLHFNPFVFAQGHFRLYGHLKAVDKGLPFFYLLHADLRAGYDVQAALLHGVAAGVVD